MEILPPSWISAQGTQREIKGAPEPDILYLYITKCNIDTTKHEIERTILENFEQVTEARVKNQTHDHSWYAAFTVTLKGNNLDADDFLDAKEVFPHPIRVLLNRNRYRDQECV